MEATILIACILLFVAFAMFGVSYFNHGVAIKNEKLVSSEPQLTARYKSLAFGLIVGTIAGYLVTGQPLITLIIGVLSAYFISNWQINSKQNKQREILEEQYIQVLTSIVSSLQGGANPYQALEETAMSIKNPAKDIFLEILRKNRTGTNYHEALGIAAKEYNWPTLKQLEMAFRLYDRTGSNLIQACNHLLQAAYDRRGDRKQVSAMTMVVRATMVVLSVLPFALIIFMRFFAPDFIAPLFHTTGGIIVSVIIVGLIVIGNKVGAKMAENILN